MSDEEVSGLGYAERIQKNNLNQKNGKDGEGKKVVITVVAICGFIIFLVVLFFYTKGNYTPKYETYTSKNNFVFVKQAGLWNTEWQEGGNLYNIHFHFNPGEAENVTITNNNLDLDRFNEGPVYVTFDPAEYGMSYMAVAASELSLNLYRALHVNVTGACTKNVTGCNNNPIIRCGDNYSVIYLKEANETGIFLDGTCITIQGKDMELVRAVDKLLFIWYKIV